MLEVLEVLEERVEEGDDDKLETTIT